MFGEVKQIARPPHAPGPRARRGRRVRRHVATCASRSSTRRGASQQLPGGHRGGVLRQGRGVPGQAADDEPGRRRLGSASARTPGAIVADLPAVGQGRGRHVAAGASSSRRRCDARRARVRRSARHRAALDELDLVDRTWAFRADPPARAHRRGAGRAARRLIFDEFLRMQVGARRAQARDRARSSRASVTRVDGDARRRRSTARCRSRSPATRRRRSTRSSPTSPAPRRCTGCCRATSVRARRWSRVSALLVAVQGGYQGAFMAPTEVLAEQHYLSARALLDDLTVPPEGRCSASGPSRVELLTNRTTAAERRRLAAGLADGRGRHRHRHARAALRRASSSAPRRGR